MKNKIVIFDLDGTLADISQRRKLAAFNKNDKEKMNWKTFFDPDNICLDVPNTPVIESFKALQAAGHTMVIFSGRDGISFKESTKWLNDNGIFPDFFQMRVQGTHTPDDVLKLGWLNELDVNGLGREDVLCVFDDRDKVVKMWRENGIPCFQVNWGEF
jgi:phosphoglycolate phosphatase-like HAD superfamily hydrolase